MPSLNGLRIRAPAVPTSKAVDQSFLDLQSRVASENSTNARSCNKRMERSFARQARGGVVIDTRTEIPVDIFFKKKRLTQGKISDIWSWKSG